MVLDPDLHDAEKEKANKNAAKNCATRFEATHNAKGVWRKTRGRSTCGRRSREIQRQSCARDPRRICLLHQPQDLWVARLRPTRGLSPPSGRAGPDLARPPRANWRSSTGSPMQGPDLSLSRARDPTPDGTTAEVDSQANKKEFINFFSYC